MRIRHQTGTEDMGWARSDYDKAGVEAEVSAFIKDVYLTDVCAIGAMYPEWLGHGKGVVNYMAVPDLPLDTAGTQFYTLSLLDALSILMTPMLICPTIP